MRGLLAIGLIIGVARADTPELEANRLLHEAKRLSDRGQVDLAIERFRAAEAIHPRGIHDCNLALAYAKLKKPAHALLYLESCRARSSGKLPDWVEPRLVETRQELARSGYVPLDVSSEPAGARVISSSLGTDSWFTAPRRVWVPLGDEELVANLAGHDEERQRVTVRSQQAVELRLHKREAVVEVLPSPAPRLEAPPAETVAPALVAIAEKAPARDTRRVRKVAGGALLGVGAGLLVAALALHLVAIFDTRPAAEQLPQGNEFQSQLNTFHLERDLSISGYAIGGVAALAGAATLISSRF